MPNSLMDMFSPRDYGGQPTGLGDMLGQRSNSLIGLGLGLMAGTGADRYGPAMRGYAQGANTDQDRYQSSQRLAEQRAARAQSLAEHRSDRAQAQRNWEQQFARSDPTKAPTEFGKISRDLGLVPGTPEYLEAAKQYYQPKTEGEWDTRDIIDPGDPDGERKITVQQNKRTGQYRRPELPGQTGAAGAAAPFTDWSADASNAPVSGAGQAQQPRHSITLPNGEVVTPPPGLSKKGREAWATDVAKTSADMQTGKMTEAQAKYSIYSTGMEIAHRELQGLDKYGTSAEGKGLGGLPWGIGAYFQSNEYQNYRNSKDAWLNAKLRAESGATINPDEFARDDRIYFPQPGEGPEQIAAKAKLREHITQKMTKAGGPGYTSPPPLATAPAGGGTAAPPAAAGAGTTGDPLVEARYAIKRGAPKAKVIERLAKEGIRFNPKDLD